MAVLESKLIIGAKDETGGAFAAIQKHIASLDKQIATFDKISAGARKVAAANDPMIASMDRGAKALMEEKAALEGLARSMAEGVSSADGMANAQGRLARETTAATRAMSRQAEEAATSARKVKRSREGKSGGLGGIGTGLTAVAAGAAGVLIPFETYEGAKKALEASASLEQQKLRVREVSGGDKTESSFAEALAAEVAAKYPAITQEKALDTYLELRGNAANQNGTINQETARRNLMTVSQAQTAAVAIGTEITPEDAQNLLKAVEGSGRAGDPTAVGKMFDSYIRAKQVFGSAIDSSKVRDYVQNAKGANFGIGEDQFFWQNIVRMTEGNASRLGNETAQTLQTLVGGHATKQTARWLVDMGLATGFTPQGGGAATIHGLKGSDTLQVNQLDWANQVLLPALQAHGVLSEENIKNREALLRKDNPNIDERTARERAEAGLISSAIARSGMRTTVTDNLAHAIANELLISRDVQQMKGASGLGAAADIGKNPIAAMKEFTGSIENFAAVVGGPLMAPAAKALDALAHSIEDFTSRLQKTQGWLPSADDLKNAPFGGPSPDAAIAALYAERRPLSPGGPGPSGWDVLNEWAAGAPIQLPGATPATPVGAMPFAPIHGRDPRSPQSGPYAYYPTKSPAAEVSVSGAATVDQTLNVRIDPSPWFKAIVDQALQNSQTLVPLIGNGTGAMDSDAGPHRSGPAGIGRM